MSPTDNDSLFGEHRDPEEIREDIRETTNEITETIGAIQSKLAPEALVAEAKEEVVDRAMSVVNNARNHPAALAVLGVGAAVVIGRAIAGARGGGTLLTLALGAVIGAATYRVLSGGNALREEDDLDGTLTQEINPSAALPTRASLE
ncbi:MAG: DUF3618 domain-containing protein [Myxococcota bacterium]|nr:DUF3618 domain-containing protein [Myxococcota bacterium]